MDLIEPTEHYSAYRWAREAAGWIADAEAQGLEPVIVGGTGFYLKSLLDPPYDTPPVTDVEYEPHYEIVDPGPVLRERIEERVDEMLAAGWLDEVRNLMVTVPRDAIAWKACGYRMMRAHVDGECTLDEARERTIIETRQYAKRQRTWLHSSRISSHEDRHHLLSDVRRLGRGRDRARHRARRSAGTKSTSSATASRSGFRRFCRASSSTR